MNDFQITLLFLSAFPLLLSLTFLIVGKTLQKNSAYFVENARRAEATVIGYDREQHSSQYTLILQLLNVGINGHYGCQCGRKKIHPHEYPAGTIVDVLYVQKRTFGIPCVEIHLVDNPPASEYNVGRVFLKIAFACLIIAAVLIVIGIAGT